MRRLTGLFLIGGALFAASLAVAQRPGGGSQSSGSKAADVDDFVARMLESDKDKDGKLSRSEMTDDRLLRLFLLADTDTDGFATKAELTTLAEKEYVEDRGFGGFGGPGGPGGPGGFGPPPFGGPMGRPGEVLPPMFQQMLRLNPEQKAQVASLQKEVEAKLAKILTSEQAERYKEMLERGPGGGGGPGGPGGGRRGGGPGGGRRGGGPGGGGPGGGGRPPGGGPPPGDRP